MKFAKYILLLVLCLMLAACGPKEPDEPPAYSSVSEPDESLPDTSVPDTSADDSLPPLTGEDKAAAYDAACDYYRGTVFEVHSLTEINAREGEITFQVSCSKGGEKVDPDRVISLERQDGVWTVLNEGY